MKSIHNDRRQRAVKHKSAKPLMQSRYHYTFLNTRCQASRPPPQYAHVRDVDGCPGNAYTALHSLCKGCIRCNRNAKSPHCIHNKQKQPGNSPFPGCFPVEVAGFEPAAFWSRTKRATKLRYTSITGADKGTRTPDLLITNQPLYQLSYIGMTSNRYYSIGALFCPVLL